MTKYTGVVTWCNEMKGNGVISREGDGEDIYFDFSKIKMDGFRILSEGQKVSYSIQNCRKSGYKYEAYDVEAI